MADLWRVTFEDAAEVETGISEVTETSALLPRVEDEEEGETEASQKNQWEAPAGFWWIEVAIFSNVFLSGFDGTVTASTYAVIGSDFNAANTVSWLTTSYLITSTAFQPLYGRFSDIFGRRACFFTATWTFLLGCLGCGIAQDVIFLNLMRALTGLGGGGLMTMATIINSDMIPFRERGMYQACQNVLHGFGAICGASLGGLIADSVGWRACFLLQVPISILAFTVGYFAIKNSEPETIHSNSQPEVAKSRSTWRETDLSGACLLVLGLSTQLAALSMGGNNYPWADIRVLICFAASGVLLIAFVIVELRTRAIPVMPMYMLRGTLAISNQISNICAGMAAYALLFMLPLYFQVVLGDSASQAGLRLVIPSLATPVGGVIAGAVMSRVGRLSELLRAGCLLLTLGNVLVALLRFHDSSWKYIIYLFPANLGQGIAYPSMLFTFLAAFDHHEQAVATSMVYLFRSLGTVYGVAASSTIIQNVLAQRLPRALEGVPNAEELIEEIRHSVTVLNHLPSQVQIAAREVYFEALRYGFIGSATVAGVALISAFFARGQGLDRSSK